MTGEQEQHGRRGSSELQSAPASITPLGEHSVYASTVVLDRAEPADPLTASVPPGSGSDGWRSWDAILAVFFVLEGLALLGVCVLTLRTIIKHVENADFLGLQVLGYQYAGGRFDLVRAIGFFAAVFAIVVVLLVAARGLALDALGRNKVPTRSQLVLVSVSGLANVCAALVIGGALLHIKNLSSLTFPSGAPPATVSELLLIGFLVVALWTYHVQRVGPWRVPFRLAGIAFGVCVVLFVSQYAIEKVDVGSYQAVNVFPAGVLSNISPITLGFWAPHFSRVANYEITSVSCLPDDRCVIFGSKGPASANAQIEITTVTGNGSVSKRSLERGLLDDSLWLTSPSCSSSGCLATSYGTISHFELTYLPFAPDGLPGEVVKINSNADQHALWSWLTCASSSWCAVVEPGQLLRSLSTSATTLVRPSLMVTQNGGRNWTTGVLPTSLVPVGDTLLGANLHCPSVAHCLISGTLQWMDSPLSTKRAGELSGAPIVVSTANGGETWTAVATPEPGTELLQVSCSRASDCMAFGSVTHASLTSVVPEELLTSSDAGSTWTSVRTNLDSHQIATLRQLSCFEANRCLASGYEEMLVTADDGRTWVSDQPPKLSGHVGFSGPFCTTAELCVVIPGEDYVPNPALFVTADGGRTWRIEKLPALQAISEASP